MRVYYLNDQKKPVSIRVIDISYNPSNPDAQYRGILQPTEGKSFDVLIPEGASLFVKAWDGQVLLSYIDRATLASLEQVQE